MRRPWLRRTIDVMLVACLLVTACTGSESNDGSPDPPTRSPSQPSSAALSPRSPAEYERVHFAAIDGRPVSGRLFGQGRVAVILSHMGRADDSQNDWAAFAGELANRGFQALTYQRRPTYGGIWKDVLGAARFLRRHGAMRIIVGGASIGAMASLRAAEEPTAALNGVIWLAGVLLGSGYYFRRGNVATVACPLLIISGDADTYGAGTDARRLHQWVTAPKQLLILDSFRHGTDIFQERGTNSRELTQAMLRFVEQVARTPAQQC
jgi:dienelactone hydrolase